MKKIIVSFLLFIIAMMSCHYVKAKEYTKRNENFLGPKYPDYQVENSYKKGNFLYECKTEKKGVWIVRITPLSSKGITTLKIPKRLGGKKVVKLGGVYDAFDEWDGPDDGRDYNLFGCAVPVEASSGYQPKKIYKRMLKIKTIRLPSTVKQISVSCFKGMPDGRNINIPKGVVENVFHIADIHWNKFTISPKNKKYKSVDDCLLSRDRKIFHEMIRKRKKLIIPKGVKRIYARAKEYEDVNTIVIPKGVTKIDYFALWTKKAATVKISKKIRGMR